jgi:hypothetical protein
MPAHVLGAGFPKNFEALAHRLRDSYGLPAAQAQRYAGILMPPARTDPLLHRLRLRV